LELQAEKTYNPSRRCTVLTTLYATDDPDLWEIALDSVLGESAPDIEVSIHLCVDGPLPERLESVLARRAPQIGLIVRNEVNLGLAKSLNRLIDTLTDEDYVFRMDADDVSLPGRFRTQIKWLEDHPEADLVGCQVMDIDDDGAELSLRVFPCSPRNAKNLLVKQNPVLHPTWCMRRTLFDDPEIRYPEAFLTEDLAFLVLMAERGRSFGNTLEVLFQWRTGSAFFRRRSSFRRGWTELVWYARAVAAVKGRFSPHMVYPVIRLLLRCLPAEAVKAIYRSGLRARLSGGR
jgi:glycosyltransferase involved in cell wall biosynthesis